MVSLRDDTLVANSNHCPWMQAIRRGRKGSKQGNNANDKMGIITWYLMWGGSRFNVIADLGESSAANADSGTIREEANQSRERFDTSPLDISAKEGKVADWKSTNKAILEGADSKSSDFNQREIAKAAGWVILEGDSTTALDMLNRNRHEVNEFSSLVNSVKRLIARHWTVQLVHTYREGNRSADRMAIWAFSLPLGLHRVANPPRVISQILQQDVIGVGFPRMCLS
ncbi:Ribonuclease H domain [Dillenia turbinata]|uniref:Ribonuclease H domain n=1 Tax=Dillenia turbinata TaxID=194707 RepID=A0AAN8W4Z8_9MAGN